MNTFDFCSPTRIHFGLGSAAEIDTLIHHTGDQPLRVVIISDPGVVRAGLVEPLELAFKRSGASATVFDAVRSDPTSADIDAAVEAIDTMAANCVVGIGGGSAMDAAKLAAVAAFTGVSCQHYGLMETPLPRRRVITVMLPTTAGTGAEVTRTAVFSDRRGVKIWAWGDELAPDVAILDPRLTADLPRDLTAATGMDALVHAIEACTHRAGNLMVSALSLQAIRLISRHLLAALDAPHDMAHRCQLTVAATLAGMAINHSGCGIAHALGHALSSLGKVHHGRAVTLALKAVYRWNLESAVPIHAEIAHAMGAAAKDDSPLKAAEAGADRFDELVDLTGLGKGLQDSDLSLDDLPRLVDATMAAENSGMCQANCRLPRREDIERMAREVLSMMPTQAQPQATTVD